MVGLTHHISQSLIITAIQLSKLPSTRFTPPYINERFTETVLRKLTLDWSFLDKAVIKDSTMRLAGNTTSPGVFGFIEILY